MADIVREYLDLPASVPTCVIEIGTFDDPASMAENLRAYVLTEDARQEFAVPADDTGDTGAAGLLRRIRASVDRAEPGDGHWVHGSFGSGKSHFMSILGLAAGNYPELWAECPNIGALVSPDYRAWLNSHSILVVPVFMLKQRSLESAIYNAVNARLAQLDKEACPFTDVEMIIARFEAKRQKLGDDAFKLLAEVGIDKAMYESRREHEPAQEELAASILRADGLSRTDNIEGLYPPSLTEGINTLTGHAIRLGYSAVAILLDELILYLAGKPSRTYLDEINALGALVDDKGGRACPLWVIVARQRNIADTVPEDKSEQHIDDALKRLDDRFPRETELSDQDLTLIAQERVLRPRDESSGETLAKAADQALSTLDPQVKDTLTAHWSEDDFRRLYPFHPALLQTLVDITNQLSRERTAIRVLYELLLERYPDLEVGQLVPYHGLFDVIFRPRGVLGGARQRARELEAVRRTYFDEIAPAIDRVFANDERRCSRAGIIAKTILLCRLTPAFREDITVGRIVNLNPENLRGKRSLATYGEVTEILTTLSNQCELVVFRGDAGNPAAGLANITIQEGVRLTTDILPQIAVSQQDCSRTFLALLSELLGQEIKEGQIPRFRHSWRGTERPARIEFTNVSELSPSGLRLENEFTLYIDLPYDRDPSRGMLDDEELVRKAAAEVGPRPIGFWLPQFMGRQDLQDLEQLAKLELLEGTDEKSRALKGQHLGRFSQDQREQVQSQIYNFAQAKRATLVQRLQDCYLKGEAKCVFLDPMISPNLDVGSLDEALDRITDAALDKLHPHHPRFKAAVQSPALAALLEDVVLPVCRSRKPLELTPQIQTRVEALALPLELGAAGARNWTLTEDGRYLRRVLKLASGSSVQADEVAEVLRNEFGFQENLCDFFLLLLIRGYGFRAYRGSEQVPDAELNFGKLAKLRLTRGRALKPVQWTEAKRRVRLGWGADSLRTSLTDDDLTALGAALGADQSVAAQDDLWRALQTVARTVGRTRREIRGDINWLTGQLGEDMLTARTTSLSSVEGLNELALLKQTDAHDGLVSIIDWSPAERTPDEVLADLAALPYLSAGLKGINKPVAETVADGRGTHEDATKLAAALSDAVDQVGAEKSLRDRIETWNKAATDWVRGLVVKREGTAVLTARKCAKSKLDETLSAIRDEVEAKLKEGAEEVVFEVTVEGDKE